MSEIPESNFNAAALCPPGAPTAAAIAPQAHCGAERPIVDVLSTRSMSGACPTRTQKLQALISVGEAVFTDPPPGGFPRYNVLSWLLRHCLDDMVSLLPWEIEEVVETVHARANNVISHGAHHLLTAGRLRELLARVPENTPIFSDRLPDSQFADPSSGWKTTALSSVCQEIDEHTQGLIDQGLIGPHRIEEREGKRFLVETVEALGAFSASVQTDSEGRQAVFLTPHY